MRDFVEKHTIYMTLAGSRLYGTSTPTSDTDKRGVCIPPPNVLLGFARDFDEYEVPGEDTKVFALRKFMALAADCNPNIIELLFVPLDRALIARSTWLKLHAHRQEFLSAKAFHTFTGYATGQLTKIETHRGWRMNPPDHKPTRAEFGLPDEATKLQDFKGINAAELGSEVASVVEAERQFRAARMRWDQYQTWLKERNRARFELESKFGYDTKHAMHLVRLLRMGKEILTSGTVNVVRPDAAELLEIRVGEWTYEQLMENVRPLKQELEEVYNKKSYVVPDAPDKHKLSDLCAELHQDYWLSYA